jgi:putative ABC transport system permease protein
MLNKLRTRLRALLRKSKMERELDEELRYHIEQQIEQNIRLEMSPEEARQAALKSFGGVEQAKERSRDTRGIRWLEELWQDLRYGARMLKKTPSFTLIAVLTLALGIGANTAIFSLFNSVVFRPLPTPEPDQVVKVSQFFRQIGAMPREAHGEVSAFSYPEVSAYRNNQTFAGLAAYVGREMILDGPEPEPILGTLVSENYFAVLRAETVAGRMFGGPEASGREALPLAVLSHRFWQRRFGGDPDIVGKTIGLNRMTFTVVGVADRKFIGAEAAIPDVWVPLVTESLLFPDRDQLAVENCSWLRMVGRLKPGVSIKQAGAELQLIASQIDRKYPGRITRLIVARGSFFSDPTQMLRLAAVSAPAFLIAVMALLLACANVANLLLARAAGRHKEIAVRLALGANRARLIRLLLTESALLSVLGGAVAVLLTSWSLKAMAPAVASAIDSALHIRDSALVLDLSADTRVLGYAMLISLGTAVGMGLIPALRATELNLATAVKDQGSTLGPRLSRSRFRSALVVVQIAISLVFLIGTGLLVRSLQKAQSLELGFVAKEILSVSVVFRSFNDQTSRAAALRREFVRKAEAIPGVRAVAAADQAPLSGHNGVGVSADGSETAPNQSALAATATAVSENYFQTLGIPLLRGRGFSEAETRMGAPVAIISETMARRLWPGRDPLGKRFIQSGQRFEVVGVAKDVISSSDLSQSDTPHYYHPLLPENLGLAFLIRTDLAPSAVVPALRTIAREIDANAQFSAHTMDEFLEQAIAPMRTGAALASALGILALLLATMGVHGLASFNVSQQMQEFGIRVALGAQERDIIRLVLRRNLGQVALGSAIGLLLSGAIAPLLSHFLVDLPPIDPVAFLGVSMLLALVTTFACCVPARRAARVDPTVALKRE